MYDSFVLKNSGIFKERLVSCMSNYDNNNESKQDKLLVIWSSADKDVAIKMAFMYTRNSKKYDWWDRVKLLVWGPSAKLLTVDEELQEHIRILKDYGVEVYACLTCANMYGVTPALKELGVEVIGMGVPLTEMLKGGWATLTC